MFSLTRLTLLALLLAPTLAVADLYGSKRDPMQHFFTPNLGDLKTAAAAARAARRHAIFVMYVRDDCAYCERMKANILSFAGVQGYYRRNFSVLAIDTRGALPITDFAGKQTTEKAFAAAQGIKLTPTIIFYGFDGKPLARINGEVREVHEFMLLGEFVASGAYRTQTFAHYKQSLGSRKGG